MTIGYPHSRWSLPLDIIGYAKFKAIRGKVTLHFEGYVARTLNAGILCGAPFMERNRLVQELHNKKIYLSIDGKHVFLGSSPFCTRKGIDSSYWKCHQSQKITE